MWGRAAVTAPYAPTCSSGGLRPAGPRDVGRGRLGHADSRLSTRELYVEPSSAIRFQPRIQS
ncbi:hypothetical protein CFP59_08980 [Streptomyces malaysiensis subsp. malaysiensis]|nr:hypothetical protein CFP59_08980 [Streptomyces sp. M56]